MKIQYIQKSTLNSKYLPVLTMLRLSSRKPGIDPTPWLSFPINDPKRTGLSPVSGLIPSFGTKIDNDVDPLFCCFKNPTLSIFKNHINK